MASEVRPNDCRWCAHASPSSRSFTPTAATSEMVDNNIGKGRSDSPPQHISVYDAVAGRVGYEGFLTEQRPSKYRDTTSTSAVPVPPEEVLFRRKGAPARYAEDDVYDANRHLQLHQRLPDSDLLKTIHAYAADYYGAFSKKDSSLDFRSMDETALLAMGILLEEAAAHYLGSTGDLALVDHTDAHANTSPEGYWYDGVRRSKVIQSDGRRGESAHRSTKTRAAVDGTATSEHSQDLK